jgi:hypothetical protein
MKPSVTAPLLLVLSPGQDFKAATARSYSRAIEAACSIASAGTAPCS